MRLNFVQVDTRTGIKEFELIKGDIIDLPQEFDVLCVSSFKNDYSPTETSIIGKLFERGISVEELAKWPKFDFRENLGVWVSADIIGQNYKNVLCVEITGNSVSYREALENLFSVVSILEVKGENVRTIALPLLGAGDQEFEIKDVIQSLLDLSLDYLKYSRVLSKIIFVIRSEPTAEMFNEEMNAFLGRKKVVAPNSELAGLLKLELTNLLSRINSDNKILSEFGRVLLSEFRSFEFGAIARKTIEFVIGEIHPESKGLYDLRKKIEGLNSVKTAPWVQHYMHIIRHFGNEAVHNNQGGEKIPDHVDTRDLEIGMFCMIRILEFYRYYKSNSIRHTSEN